MWAVPAVSPSSPPRETQETSEILSVHLCQQKQFCRFPTGSQSYRQNEAAVPEGRQETPTWLQDPHTPLSRGDPKQACHTGTHLTPCISQHLLGSGKKMEGRVAVLEVVTHQPQPSCTQAISKTSPEGPRQHLLHAQSSCPNWLLHYPQPP